MADDDLDPGGIEGVLKPRERSDLKGHEQSEKLLLDLWRQHHVPQALMITGPKGTGKASLAFRFARFLLKHGDAGTDDQPSDLFVNPEDAVFHRVAGLGHADLLLVQRPWDKDRKKFKTEIPVATIRKLGDFFHKTSGEGGWRIAIIDSADEMNRNAANALLKVLEEPPARCLLILVVHNQGRLLPTIKSRCQRLDLRPLPDEDVVQILQDQNPEITQESAVALAALGQGSPGRSMTLAAADAVALYDKLHSVVHALPAVNIPAAHAFGDSVNGAAGEGVWHIMKDLTAGLVSRIIRCAATGQVPQDLGLNGERDLVARLGDDAARRKTDDGLNAGLEPWLEVWEKMNRLFERVDAVNLDRKTVYLDLFQAMSQAAGGRHP